MAAAADKTAEKNDDAEAPKRVLQQLSPASMLGNEYVRTVWCVTAEDQMIPADLHDKHVWANLAATLRIGDRIEVMAFDRSWFSEVIVRDNERNDIQIGVIHEVTFKDAAVKAEKIGDYEIQYFNPIRKYGVRRASDKHLLRDGLQTKAAAYAFMTEHMQRAA